MYIGKIVATHPCHMSVVAESGEVADLIFWWCQCLFFQLELPSVLWEFLC